MIYTSDTIVEAGTYIFGVGFSCVVSSTITDIHGFGFYVKTQEIWLSDNKKMKGIWVIFLILCFE